MECGNWIKIQILWTFRANWRQGVQVSYISQQEKQISTFSKMPLTKLFKSSAQTFNFLFIESISYLNLKEFMKFREDKNNLPVSSSRYTWLPQFIFNLLLLLLKILTIGYLFRSFSVQSGITVTTSTDGNEEFDAVI